MDRAGEQTAAITLLIVLESTRLLMFARAAPVHGRRGDKDVPAGALKPKRLTPGAVGGLIPDVGVPVGADGAGLGTGRGSPPLLVAVRGGRVSSTAFFDA